MVVLTKTDERVSNSEEENIMMHSSMRAGVGIAAIAKAPTVTV